ncbi:MAG: gliding motility lipoprotein GldD [Bacteroidia bacterium]
MAKQARIPFFFFILSCIFSLVSAGCGNDEDDVIYSPKPRAYFRIDFPAKKYKIYDSICPFTFETPVYSVVEKDADKNSEPCWLNIKYPQFRAQLHISYKTVDKNLATFIEQSREMAIRHQVKATGLDQQPIIRDSAKVFGLMYDIAGNTASAVQFYLTDSTRHFLRGSLYFNVATNIDSQKVVIDFLREDIIRLIQSFKWKDAAKVK